jgi:hypothetical protein
MQQKKFSAKRLLCVCALIVTATVAAVSVNVFAKYINGSKVENTFSRSDYDSPTVSDTVSAAEDGFFYKSNVTVTAGKHNYPVYVRVNLIVTWQDNDGNIYGQQPVLGTDYTLEYNDTDWTKESDGYFYCNTAIAGGETTPPLIGENQKLKQIKASPNANYSMHVEVVAETIQAIGTTESGITARNDAWSAESQAETPTDTEATQQPE